jgi:hypothetical protein
MARALTLAGIGALGLGMVLVVFGVIVPGLFMPGTWVLVVGFAALAVAGIAHVVPRGAAAASRGSPPRATGRR